MANGIRPPSMTQAFVQPTWGSQANITETISAIARMKQDEKNNKNLNNYRNQTLQLQKIKISNDQEYRKQQANLDFKREQATADFRLEKLRGDQDWRTLQTEGEIKREKATADFRQASLENQKARLDADYTYKTNVLENEQDKLRKTLILEYGGNVFDSDNNFIPPTIIDKNGNRIKNPNAPTGATVDIENNRYVTSSNIASQIALEKALEKFQQQQDVKTNAEIDNQNRLQSVIPLGNAKRVFEETTGVNTDSYGASPKDILNPLVNDDSAGGQKIYNLIKQAGTNNFRSLDDSNKGVRLIDNFLEQLLNNDKLFNKNVLEDTEMAIGRLNAYTTILQANPNLNVSELNEKITRINSLINARKAQLKEYETNLPKTREEQFQRLVNPTRIQY
tara:strand:- start:370 stop:1548 length:1179 start_codon:yes stop_codon:yes gene_type:complete